MRNATLLLAGLALFGPCPLSAQEAPPPWERQRALIAVQGTDVGRTVSELLNLTIAGDSLQTIELLEATRTRTDWPGPARDAAVDRFTKALRDLPGRAVSQDILTYLKAYPQGTMVPRVDHPYGVEPLFNIRAQAHGLESRWLRQEAQLEGLALLDSNPRALADAWLLERDPPVRGGYLDALQRADQQQLRSFNAMASTRLADEPDLTAPAAQAALLSADISAMVTVLDEGTGPGLAIMLREAARLLPPFEADRLLHGALNSPNGMAASLAIAELYPATAGSAAADAELLARLDHPTLGSTIALALARHGSRETRQSLLTLAETAEPRVARRIAIALELNPAAERQP